jgi:hypothetical protein
MSCSTPATDVGCAADDSFYEVQYKEWCGMHCLNNYAGRKAISRQDCYNAVEEFLVEIKGAETYDAHLDRENGRLTHDLIAYLACKNLGLTLDWCPDAPSRGLDRAALLRSRKDSDDLYYWLRGRGSIDQPLSDGLLNYNHKHWTVLKRSGDR